MNKNTKKRRLPVRIGRIVAKTLLIAIAAVLFIFLLLQTPPAQNIIRKKLVAYLEKKLETRVSVENMSIGLNRLSLGNLYLEDKRRDTLLAGGNAVVYLNLLKLFFNNELDVKSILLEDFYARVKRELPDTIFNFQFLVDAFTTTKPGKEKSSDTISYAIPKVHFRNIRFNYKDVISGMDTEGSLGELDMRIDAFDPANLHVDLPATEITGLHARFYQYKPLIQDSIVLIDSTTVPRYPRIDLGKTRLKDIKLDFQNHVSSFFANIQVGELEFETDAFDYANRSIDMEALSLANSTIHIHLGRSKEAKKVEVEVEEEVEQQAEAGWKIRLANLDLQNNNLKFDNDNHPRQSRGMDYAHLDAKEFTLMVDDFLLKPDSIGGIIQAASFREQSGFVLEQLRGKVLYANTTILLDELYLKTPGSEVKRFARLEYASPTELAKNFKATKMDFDIAGTYVKVSDILTFAPVLARQPAFSKPHETWYLNLQGSGTLASFHLDQLQFNGLSNTQLDASGSLAISNTTRQTGGALTIRHLHTTQSDIALFTGSRLSRGKTRIPEEFDITGTLRGGANGFTTNLDIASSAGNLTIEGEINNLSNPSTATYNANVQTQGLDLGYIFSNKDLDRVTGEVVVNGRGLKAGSFDTKFKGTLLSVGYNNYLYRNIQLDGTLHGSALSLTTDIRDPNIDLSGTLVTELSASPSFRFTGFVDSLKLEPLHFTGKPVIVRGKIEADVPVFNNDLLQADVLLTEALFVSESQRLPLDSIRLTAGRVDSIQFINLSSDIATADLRGQFRVSELGRIFQKNLQPYLMVTSNKNTVVTEPYSIAFNAHILNAPVLADLVPGLTSFEPIQISGTINSSDGINARASTTSLVYQGNQVQGLQLNITSTPSGLLFNGDLQRLKSKSFDIYHTSLKATALNNKIDFRLSMDDAAARQRYFFSGIFDQSTPGSYTLNLRPDSLLLNYERWTITPGNSITIGKDQLLARDFVLSKGPEILSLQSSGDLLNVGFTNFQLSTITAFLKSDSLLANGRMTGTVSFRNLIRQPVFTGNLDIADLSIRGDTLGNMALNVDNLANRYQVNSTITGRGNDVSLTGSFTPSGEKDILLNMDLAIRQLQLSTIDGALGGFLKNSSGTLSGNISIAGSAARPVIDGPLNFNNASFALKALGSQFRIDGEQLTVTDNGFRFDDFVIRDTANQTLRLNGNVNTTDFSSFVFDLRVQADNFKLLNTTKKDNKIYYGEMVVTTEMHVGGNSEKPIIDGSITVNDGTNLTIVIPQREPGVIAREGIVEFVDMENPANDTLFRAYDSLNLAPFTGMDIAANIEIRKEAIFNIIIDEANGDFLNIQGEAILTSGIDPSGKITLVGNYELERGAYEITFNFLRRRFDIQKGSRIQWFNEPTRANLDVTAVYIANTSPIDLVQQQIDAATPAIRNTYLQKLPFEVRLHLTGELLQPGVAFDIVLPENKSYGVSNDIITQVSSRLAQLRSDPGEINKQVFALLLLNRFVGENPFASSADNFSASMYARQSVTKLLTEQLNQLAAGLFDGVDLQFDISSTEDYTTGERRTRTDLNIGLSKQLLNERLTVSVGTNFELEGARDSKQGSSSTIGNLSVDYTLTRDKRFLIRFYRKNEYQGIVDGYVVESGLSFIITVDYEKFRELITRRKKQKVENVE